MYIVNHYCSLKYVRHHQEMRKYCKILKIVARGDSSHRQQFIHKRNQHILHVYSMGHMHPFIQMNICRFSIYAAVSTFLQNIPSNVLLFYICAQIKPPSSSSQITRILSPKNSLPVCLSPDLTCGLP